MTDPREEIGRNKTGRDDRRQSAAYQAAAESVLAVPIAAGIGYWADRKFDTSPWLLLLGVVLGFSAFVLRLVRLGQSAQGESRPEGAREPSPKTKLDD